MYQLHFYHYGMFIAKALRYLVSLYDYLRYLFSLYDYLITENLAAILSLIWILPNLRDFVKELPWLLYLVEITGSLTGDWCCTLLNYFLLHTPNSKVVGANMGPSGADRTQVGPLLATWTLLSGTICWYQTGIKSMLSFLEIFLHFSNVTSVPGLLDPYYKA